VGLFSAARAAGTTSRVVAALATAVALVAGAAPAQGAVAAPSSRTYGPQIDAVSGWERESTCSPTEKKGPRRLRALLTRTYGLIPSNIVRPCSASDSGHEEGRALDWMVNVRDPGQRAVAESFLAWLQAPDAYGNAAAMARRLGISYVIWDNRTWRPRDLAWTDYNGCTKPRLRWKKYDTTCHRNHVHVSFSWDGALARTSFWSGLVACPPPPADAGFPALLPAVGGVVPIAPAKALDTRTGLGLPGGPCRVHPDVRLDLPLLGVGGVPATGVAAVTLSVRATALDAPAQLRAWTGGSAQPAAAVAVGGKGAPAVADVTVPVGTNGVVSLQLAGGMGRLAVDVTGYVVGAAT
jgi:hypothetical protein